MCVGFKLNTLLYSSLYLVKPPNPEGMFIEVFAISFKIWVCLKTLWISMIITK